jgi:hypothetical protein
LQEFTSQVHNAGSGVSHAIGTGSHDLSGKIKGLTTMAALEALEADQQTKIIAIISKPPEAGTLAVLLERIRTYKKPVVGCILGIEPGSLSGKPNFQPAATIDEATQIAIASINGATTIQAGGLAPEILAVLKEEKRGWAKEQKYLRGILAGGTFCTQSQQILSEAGLAIHSNSPIEAKNRLDHPDRSIEHTIVDMGDDFYMVGKPHPMIDGTMRRHRVINESRDPHVAVLYLDFILGYNASMDPVGELLDAILEAKRLSKQRGGHLTVVASVCGTEDDPQDLGLQVKLLQEAGVIVFRSNALASIALSQLLGKG